MGWCITPVSAQVSATRSMAAARSPPRRPRASQMNLRKLSAVISSYAGTFSAR